MAMLVSRLLYFVNNNDTLVSTLLNLTLTRGAIFTILFASHASAIATSLHLLLCRGLGRHTIIWLWNSILGQYYEVSRVCGHVLRLLLLIRATQLANNRAGIGSWLWNTICVDTLAMVSACGKGDVDAWRWFNIWFTKEALIFLDKCRVARPLLLLRTRAQRCLCSSLNLS